MAQTIALEKIISYSVFRFHGVGNSLTSVRVHSEPENVCICIKRAQRTEKGKVDLQGLQLMLIKLGVTAVLGNRPMPVGQVTVVVPGVVNQNAHESRSGVM